MFQSLEGNSQNKTKLGSKSISYNEIAIKLLEDKLLLTALELHSELIESGKEIKHLKDFFSNPGNFEFQASDVPSRLARSGSQNTLDSLDLTRYSEDGGGTDERISILEFELRKAQETINALRNNLTVATESASNTKDEGRTMTVGNIQPHEQRALNFLINEYLLLNRYKLTSITFADENQQQDFDDWDDVGLNIAKPPELLSLYREGLKYVGVNTLHKEVQTDENEKNQVLIEEMTDTLINEALSSDRKRKMVQIFDDISDCLCQVADLAEFIRLSHPQMEYIQTAQIACATVSGIVEKLNTNLDLYKVLRSSVKDKDVIETSDVDKLVGELFLFDFEQCGIHLPERERDKIVRLNSDILMLGQEFVSGTSNPKVIRKSTLPPNIREVFLSDGENIVISGLYSDSANAIAREMAYKIFLHPDPQQEQILHELLQSRNELAKACGFNTYSERALRGATVDAPLDVLAFLEYLNQNISDKVQNDFECMSTMKKSDCKGSNKLEAWDVPYYTHIAKKDWFRVSAKEYSPYFSLGACMDGLNMLFQSLYGIQLVNSKVEPGEIWYPDVYKLAIMHETEGLLGYIYCDLYERTGKPNQDCHFTIKGGRNLPDESYQLPIVVLMLNLPAPRWSSPSLLTPSMVDNLFHEMGHAMHSMLGRTRYQHVTGTRCSTDFAEVPSILMEYFASDIRVLKRFARHFQTKQPMPDEMLHRLCASKHLFSASETQLQLFYAALDQKYHGEHPLKGSTTEVLAETQNSYYGLPYVPNTAWQLRFSHLVGYGAKYYSYLVSRSVAYLIWQKYFEKDPFSRENGEKYRRECLAFGGGKNPKKLISDFLDVHVTPEVLGQSVLNEIESYQKQVDRVRGKETLIKHQKTCIENLKSENTHLKTVNLELQLENNILCEPKISSSPVLETASIHDSNDSNSTERFEIIERNTPMFRKKDFDESISNKSFNANDWLDISTEKGSEDNSECKSKEPNPDIVSQGSYMDEVLALCYINIPKELEAETLDYITNESVTNDTLVHALTTTLLKIIPNIILNKREEVIPLIVSAVLLNPKASERDKLLQQLFNLKKRPTETERLTILTGLMSIAKQSEEKLIENEILPQCWLQLTHKYVERRLLVTEACTMLIPYVSGPIRNSLILSMLQQMIEDKEGTVRERVIKALALLFSLCDDNDKYNQCEKLGLNTLNDSSNSVVSLSVQILFPVLAKWALSAGYLHSSLLKKLLHNLNDDIRSVESQNKNLQTFERIQRMITVIENLLPFLLLSVAVHENVTVNIEKDSSMELRSDFLKICTNLTNPEKVLKPDLNCGMLFYEFDKYIGENPNIFWEKMDWVVDIMLPDLLNNLQHIEVTHQLVLQRFINLFTHIFICFGPNFSKYKVKPLLQKKIQNLEQVINSLNQYCPSLSIIPIYLILLSLSEDFEELSSVLKKFLCDLPLFGAPLDCLEIAVKRLCDMNLQTFVIDCLWTGVVHQRPLVKSATASLFADIIPVCSVDLIKSKIVGAIVTLANDNDVLVRTATIPALGSLVNNCITKEVHDKVYMQLQTYINDNSLKENHTLARQLIVTLGNIVTNCTPMFKNDVILPHLTSLAISTSQMTNQTRKVDMALALLESFTNVVYMSHDDTNVYSVIKPGLKCLETVISENQSLSVHHETALSLLRECDNRLCLVAASSPSMERNVSLSQNVNQGVEEMRQKMNKMFSKPSISKSTTLPNLQGIFKKK